MAGSRLGERVKSQMNRIDIHDVWEGMYRTPGNERLFEECYDYITGLAGQPRDSLALDIGCGICANSLRLARRGYLVKAGDYSEPILEQARENVATRGQADRIDISRQDITRLDYADESFDLTLCWGVLMHIPDVDDAITQLVRVTRPGGYLAFEEVNVRSPESVLKRIYWRLRNLVREKKIRFVRTPIGIEHIVSFHDEELFWRQVRVNAFVERMKSEGLELVGRRAGMFTEAHLGLPRALQAPVDAWNRFYHAAIGFPGFSKHVIFVFRKTQ